MNEHGQDGSRLGSAMEGGDTIPADDPTGRLLIDGRYEIQEKLGEGGMGSVYRATHVMMDKPVAIKLIHGELAHIDEVAKRFEREAKSASRVTNPHCITTTDFGRTDDGTLFLVMELLEGESLAQRLKHRGDLSVEASIKIIKQILQALAYAHKAGVVHRDLKPENVMLTVQGEERDFVKVLDFGIAKLASSTESSDNLTQAGFIVGTPGYLAPEQARGLDADHRADLYSAGVILYEMLAGSRPFNGESAMDVITAHLISPIPALPSKKSHSKEMQKILERAMAKEPQDRFDSAEEMLAAIEEIEHELYAPPGLKEPSPIVAITKNVVTQVGTLVSPAVTKARPFLATQKARYDNLPPKKRRLVQTLFGLGLAVLLVATIAWIAGDGAKIKENAPIEVAELPDLDSSEQETIKKLFDEADSRLRLGQPGEAEKAVKKALELSPNQPVGHLLLGHALFLKEDRVEAMKSYGKALILDSDLADDARLVDNLQIGLKSKDVKETAASMLIEFCGKRGIELLISRANTALFDSEERHLAREFLIKAGKEDSINWIASLSADFEQSKSCPKRKEIIAEMEKTGDPDFLPLLRENLPPKKRRRGVFRRSSKNRLAICVAKDLKRAIKTLEEK